MLLQDIIPAELPTAVQLKTILNHVERHKSFVYQEARWVDPATKTAIEIPIQPRANGRAICSGCGQPAPATIDWPNVDLSSSRCGRSQSSSFTRCGASNAQRVV